MATEIKPIARQCVIALMFIFLSMTPSPALATVNISVVPEDGGNTLRFGRLDVPERLTKQIRVRVTSDEAKQYQIFQRVIQPFENEFGDSINRPILSAETQAGSNTSGSLYLSSVEPVDFSEQLIYSSDQNGTSDAFSLYYQVNPEYVSAAGDYLGKILFSVRPIGSSSYDEVILNIYIEASGGFKFETESSKFNSNIQLELDQDGNYSDYVTFKFDGNYGRELKVYQELIEWPVNENGVELNLELLNVSGSGARNGEFEIAGTQAVDIGRTLVYSTTNNDDEFAVTYHLNAKDMQSQVSGNYNGRIQFVVESAFDQKIYIYDVRVRIDPVFKISVTYPPGERGLRFDKLLPDSPPQLQEAIVSVNTNLGSPYQVTQSATGLLTNEKGSQFSEKYFQVKEEFFDGSGSGTLEHPEFTSFQEGDMPLYLSDDTGSPVKFRVFYLQKPYPTMEPGEYKTAITYSLGEI